MSTGEVLVARAAMKPLATLNRPTLKTVDTATKEETVSFKERTDVTAVPAMGVVAETMVALVLADEATRKFGGDSRRRAAPQPRRLRRDAGLSADGRARRARGPHGLRQDHRRPSAGGAARPPLRRRRRGRSRSAPAGRSPRSSRSDGEEAFRDLEADVLDELLEHHEPRVIASGGGVVLRAEQPGAARGDRRHRGVARRGPAFLASRIERKAHRPLLAGDESPREVLERLHGERAPLYAEVADLVVDVEPFHAREEKPKRALAERIAGARLAARGGGDGVITVEVPLPATQLPGARRRRRARASWPSVLPARRAARRRRDPARASPLEVDPGREHRRFEIGDGEAAKSLATVEELCRAWAALGPHPRRRRGRRRRGRRHRHRSASPPPATTAASPSCTCPPRCSAWSTRPSAARPA